MPKRRIISGIKSDLIVKNIFNCWRRLLDITPRRNQNLEEDLHRKKIITNQKTTSGNTLSRNIDNKNKDMLCLQYFTIIRRSSIQPKDSYLNVKDVQKSIEELAPGKGEERTKMKIKKTRTEDDQILRKCLLFLDKFKQWTETLILKMPKLYILQTRVG